MALSIQERIKDLRLDRGLTLEQLAEQIGLSKSALGSYMNNVVKGWKAFSNPRHFPEPYGRQKGWERIASPDNEEEEFHDITEAEAEQLELLGDWLK